MIDIVKPTRINRPHFDALHGHTVIELKNVKNGKRERVESDNTVTGFAEFLASPMGLNEHTYLSTGKPPFRSLFGGIFLFDTAIPLNAKYKPPITKMLGNGSYDVSNSATAEMGSFNTLESSMDANGATFVYDFLTSQSNGAIASVCLSTDTGGYIGYGNPSGVRVGSRTAWENYSISFGAIGGLNFGYYGYYDNKAYSCANMASGDNKIVISESNFVVNKINRLDTNSSFTDVFTNPKNYSISASVNMAMHPQWSGYICVMLPSSNISNGGAFPIYTVNLKTGVVGEYAFTNNTGYTLNFSGDLPCGIPSDAHCLYISASSSKHFKLTLATGTFEEIGDFTAIRVTDSLFCSEMQNSNGMWIYDPEAGTIYPANGRWAEYGSYSANQYYDTDDGGFFVMQRQNNYISKYPNPLILTTINNLSNAVIKTAAQTMKVTYTLTLE